MVNFLVVPLDFNQNAGFGVNMQANYLCLLLKGNFAVVLLGITTIVNNVMSNVFFRPVATTSTLEFSCVKKSHHDVGRAR